jgi:hypothetical protein
MLFKPTGCKDVDWIHLAEERKEWQPYFNTVMILLVPQTSDNLSIT